jgi:hypothetical protein
MNGYQPTHSKALKLEKGGTYVIECDIPISDNLMDVLAKAGNQTGINFVVLSPGMRIAREVELQKPPGGE